MTNQHSKQGGQIKVGEHLSLFVEDLSDLDATQYKYYFRGGIKVVEAIIDDVEKEYKFFPRLSNFAYESILVNLHKWLKEIRSLEKDL